MLSDQVGKIIIKKPLECGKLNESNGLLIDDLFDLQLYIFGDYPQKCKQCYQGHTMTSKTTNDLNDL